MELMERSIFWSFELRGERRVAAAALFFREFNERERERERERSSLLVLLSRYAAAIQIRSIGTQRESEREREAGKRADWHVNCRQKVVTTDTQ